MSYLIVLLIIFAIAYFHERKKVKRWKINWMICRRLYDLSKKNLSELGQKKFHENLDNDVVEELINANVNGSIYYINRMNGDKFYIKRLEDKGFFLKQPVPLKYQKDFTEYLEIKSDMEPSLLNLNDIHGWRNV